jgi:hypothetical protein
MKRVISIAFLSIVLSVIIWLAYSFVQFNRSFVYDDEPVDTHLHYNSNRLKHDFLKKAGYKVKTRIFPYRKNRHNCIIMDYQIEESTLDEYRNWLEEGKTLVLYYPGSWALPEAYNMADSFEQLFNDVTEDFVENSANEESEELQALLDQILIADDTFESQTPDGPDKMVSNVYSLWTKREPAVTRAMLQDMSGDVVPLVTAGDSILVAKERYNGGTIIYIMDIFLFSDRSLIKDDNTHLLNNIYRKHYSDGLLFDYLNAPEMNNRGIPMDNEDKPLPWWLVGNIKWIMLQLLVILVLFFLAGMKRFGKPMNKEKFERRSLLRHLEAVGFYFEKMGNPEIVVNRFDHLFLYELKKSMKGAPFTGADLVEEVKKRYDVTPEEFDIFVMNSTSRIAERQKKRLQFLKKLRKG